MATEVDKKKIKPSYSNDTTSLGYLLRPSWLSGMIAIICGLVISIGVVAIFNLHNSSVQQQLLGLQNSQPEKVLTKPGEAPPNTNENSLQNTWPLLAFWAFLGLAAYFILEELIGVGRNIAAVRKELNYVNAQRNEIIRSAVRNISIRILVVILWLIFTELFFKKIIPYSITAAHAGAAEPFSPTGLLYIAISFLVIALSFHAHTIFMRLAARRPRVFSRTGY